MFSLKTTSQARHGPKAENRPGPKLQLIFTGLPGLTVQIRAGRREWASRVHTLHPCPRVIFPLFPLPPSVNLIQFSPAGAGDGVNPCKWRERRENRPRPLN